MPPHAQGREAAYMCYFLSIAFIQLPWTSKQQVCWWQKAFRNVDVFADSVLTAAHGDAVGMNQSRQSLAGLVQVLCL